MIQIWFKFFLTIIISCYKEKHIQYTKRFSFELFCNIFLSLSDVLASNFIAVTDNSHGRILQIDLLTGRVVKLPLSIKKTTGLALDKSTMTLFYSDVTEKAIISTTLQGKNKKLLYAPGSC